jgi:transcriptional regulator with XRE-family HTH domain
MSLAARLKEHRIRKGMSLQDVADAVGASKAHIWDLETGRSKNPTIDLLAKLAKAFSVSIADLIGENPAGEGEDSSLVAMYRELQELSPRDREAIKRMVEHLKSRDDSQ